MPIDNLSYADREHRSASLFNYAKIIALAVAAGWALFQWDNMIFPEATDKRIARQAAFRADLAIDNISFAAENKKLKNSYPDNIKLFLINGTVRLKNDTKYPVAYFPQSARLTLQEFASLKTDDPAPLLELGRIPKADLTLETLIGRASMNENEPIIVEAQKTVQTSVSTLVQLQFSPESNFALLTLKFPFKTQPVDLIEQAPDSEKEKNRIAQAMSIFDTKTLQRETIAKTFQSDAFATANGSLPGWLGQPTANIGENDDPNSGIQ